LDEGAARVRKGRWIIAMIIFCAAVVVGDVLLVGNWQSVPELPKASCGSALVHRMGGDTSIVPPTDADSTTLNCFNAAARGCKPASIQVVEMGVDAGTAYVFRIELGGRAGCHVVELSQDYGAGWPGTYPVNSQTCDAPEVTSWGVRFSCGGQDVWISAVVNAVNGGPMPMLNVGT
jgi:hypothetical protein